MLFKDIMRDIVKEFVQNKRIYLKLVVNVNTYAILRVSRPYKIENSHYNKGELIFLIAYDSVIGVCEDYVVSEVCGNDFPYLFKGAIIQCKTNKKGIIARRERKKLLKYLKEIELSEQLKKDLLDIALMRGV